MYRAPGIDSEGSTHKTAQHVLRFRPKGIVLDVLSLPPLQETLANLRLWRLKLTRLRLKRRHVGYATVTDAVLSEIVAISPQLAELHIIDKTENVRVLVRERSSPFLSHS